MYIFVSRCVLFALRIPCPNDDGPENVCWNTWTSVHGVSAEHELTGASTKDPFRKGV